jgi:hypothetical protein
MRLSHIDRLALHANRINESDIIADEARYARVGNLPVLRRAHTARQIRAVPDVLGRHFSLPPEFKPSK